MVTKRRPKQLSEGTVFAVPLKDDFFGFGQVCHGGDFAFFDLRSNERLTPTEVVQHPVLFRVPVARDAVSVGKWIVLGEAHLSAALAQRGKYKHQPVGSEQAFLYCGGASVPVTQDELKGLETLATWFSFHIEERLADYFAGRPNRYVAELSGDRKPRSAS